MRAPTTGIPAVASPTRTASSRTNSSTPASPRSPTGASPSRPTRPGTRRTAPRAARPGVCAMPRSALPQAGGAREPDADARGRDGGGHGAPQPSDDLVEVDLVAQPRGVGGHRTL